MHYAELGSFFIQQENFNKIRVEDNKQWTTQSPRNNLQQCLTTQNKTGQPK